MSENVKTKTLPKNVLEQLERDISKNIYNICNPILAFDIIFCISFEKLNLENLYFF